MKGVTQDDVTLDGPAGEGPLKEETALRPEKRERTNPEETWRKNVF